MGFLNTIIWGSILSTIGLGFFVYGRKQKAAVPLFSGVTLFIIPYIIPNVFLLILVSVALIVLPFVVKA